MDPQHHKKEKKSQSPCSPPSANFTEHGTPVGTGACLHPRSAHQGNHFQNQNSQWVAVGEFWAPSQESEISTLELAP
jgi:hypothetical protein